MVLFCSGDFVLHSGDTAQWKIDCTALTRHDWAALASMAAKVLPPFATVEGVPKGGLAFADALRLHTQTEWCTLHGNPDGCGTKCDARMRPVTRVLLADDVYTTGASLHALRGGRENVIGVVLFARRPVQESWITPLFTWTGDHR